MDSISHISYGVLQKILRRGLVALSSRFAHSTLQPVQRATSLVLQRMVMSFGTHCVWYSTRFAYQMKVQQPMHQSATIL